MSKLLMLFGALCLIGVSLAVIRPRGVRRAKQRPYSGGDLASLAAAAVITTAILLYKFG
ncbi:hypothetical protein [Lacticaseibacillus absianus]|uniref:hypothetical protein n=1 Tax=Lacticaseibacillus absianus TaxID=2729623 RepID=UPI0015CEC620|nr:hypothetical protein [Lacticaseibacillus absianus]